MCFCLKMVSFIISMFCKLINIIFFFRDRTPFVLTSDMVYVINGGDKPSTKFQNFVDICVQGFNIVRKHGNLLLNLFGLVIINISYFYF